MGSFGGAGGEWGVRLAGGGGETGVIGKRLNLGWGGDSECRIPACCTVVWEWAGVPCPRSKRQLVPVASRARMSW